MQPSKSLHIPLPVIWYEKLRLISTNSDTSATEFARAAIIAQIKEQEKETISQEIAQFASEYGGTELDLDKDLEEAGLEHLRKESL